MMIKFSMVLDRSVRLFMSKHRTLISYIFLEVIMNTTSEVKHDLQKVINPLVIWSTKMRKGNSSISPNKSASSLFITAGKPIDPKLLNLTRDTPKQPVIDMEEYFERMFREQQLNLRAKHVPITFKLTQESDQVLKDSNRDHIIQLFKGEIKLNPQGQDADDSMSVMEREYENIQALQERITRGEIADNEKVRRQVALQIVDLEQNYYALRFDQISERQALDKQRKELTNKLLSIEDKIQKLKHSLVLERRNHHFSSNHNLHNSQLDLSIISQQRDYVVQWENDPEQVKRRQEFVDRQMKEWQEAQDRREQKVKEMEKEIKVHEEEIKRLKIAETVEKNAKKRKEISVYLVNLEKTQEERLQEYKRTDIIVREILKQKTLAEQYAKQDAMFMTQEINAREEKLKQIAQQYKPIDLEAINEHDQNFLQIHVQEEAKREQKAQTRASEWNKFKAQYFSENYRKAQEDVKIHKNPHEDELKKATEKLEIHKKMQKKVLEKYLPQSDPSKEAELKQAIEELQHHSDFKQYKHISENVKSKKRTDGISKKILMKQLKAKAKLVPLKPLDSLPVPQSPRSVGLFYLKDKARYNKKQIRSQSPQPPREEEKGKVKLPVIAKTSSEAQFIKRDYLKEIRQKNILPQRDILHDWEDLAHKQKNSDTPSHTKPSKKNLPPVGDLLNQEAHRIERKAKLHEQLLRARNVSDNKLIEDEEKVDDMFVNSIKAKLFVLDKDVQITLPKPKKKQVKNSELFQSQEYSIRQEDRPVKHKKEAVQRNDEPEHKQSDRDEKASSRKKQNSHRREQEQAGHEDSQDERGEKKSQKQDKSEVEDHYRNQDKKGQQEESGQENEAEKEKARKKQEKQAQREKEQNQKSNETQEKQEQKDKQDEQDKQDEKDKQDKQDKQDRKEKEALKEKQEREQQERDKQSKEKQDKDKQDKELREQKEKQQQKDNQTKQEEEERQRKEQEKQNKDQPVDPTKGDKTKNPPEEDDDEYEDGEEYEEFEEDDEPEDPKDAKK